MQQENPVMKNQHLKPNPFEVYRDPNTGQWHVVQPQTEQNSGGCSRSPSTAASD